MKKFLCLATSFTLASALSAAPKPSAKMGKGLYEQAGANSCLYCHGIAGEGGNVKAAAKLNDPSTWKIYKILGGKAALDKNPEDFRNKMKEATLSLIIKGAIIHNATFKKPWYDIKKAGSPYDAQMLGLAGAPSKKWVNKFKSKGVTPEIAAEAVYMHVQSFDTKGVFKK